MTWHCPVFESSPRYLEAPERVPFFLPSPPYFGFACPGGLGQGIPAPLPEKGLHFWRSFAFDDYGDPSPSRARDMSMPRYPFIVNDPRDPLTPQTLDDSGRAFIKEDSLDVFSFDWP
jgi:hypothetical protein